METVLPPLPHQSVWDTLAFTDFDADILKQRKDQWLSIAEEALGLLPTGNVTIVAETSAGKTVIALLAAYALGKPTLFMAPMKKLVGQHAELFGKIVGSRELVCSYTGETSRRKRIWHDPERPFTFATPHVVHNGIPKGFVELGKYGLLIVDECDLCTGQYPYVRIVEEACASGVPIIALTASLGKPLRKAEVLRILDVDALHLLEPKVATARKAESSIIVPVGEVLKEIDQLLTSMFHDYNQVFNEYGYEVVPNRVLSMRNLQSLRQRIENAHAIGDPYASAAASVHARYFKLLYARITVMTECYEKFLEYMDKLRFIDTSGAAKALLADTRLQKVETLARANLLLHPKVVAYVENQCSLHRAGVRSITFVAQKGTARALAQRLAERGITVALIFGGKDKNVQAQYDVLGRLQRGEIHGIIATSAIERGMNVPEVGAAVHYSMPMTAIQRIQRSGRTARVHSGSVIFIALEHPLDTIFLYVTRQKPDILPKPPADNFERKIKRLRGRRKKKTDIATFDLFIQPQSA